MSPPLVAPPHYDDNHPSRFVFIFLRRFFPFPCSSFSSSSSAFAIIPRSVFLPHSAAPFSLHFLIRSSLLIRGLFASSFAPPLYALPLSLLHTSSASTLMLVCSPSVAVLLIQRYNIRQQAYLAIYTHRKIDVKLKEKGSASKSGDEVV